MKAYETIVSELAENIPIILRLDGRAFHTFCRGLEKPFDEKFIGMMNEIAKDICGEIQNARMAYIQSDEISVLIHKGVFSDSWFKNDIQKMVSISASRASSFATKWCYENDFKKNKIITFDSRVFLIPEKDVVNYFVWRQRDWERNSVQMLARSLYSAKQLYKKSNSDMQEMIFQKGRNWNSLSTYLRRGRCCLSMNQITYVDNQYFKGDVERNRWMIDNAIPIFTKDRGYIEKMMKLDEV